MKEKYGEEESDSIAPLQNYCARYWICTDEEGRQYLYRGTMFISQLTCHTNAYIEEKEVIPCAH